MKLLNPVLYVALIVCLLSHAGCLRNSAAVSEGTSGAGPEGSANDIEKSIKEKALLKAPAPQANSLRVLRRIKSELGGGDKLVYPVSLAVSDTGVVYLSDNNAHVVRYSPPNSDSVITLPIQEGQGKLYWPTSIETWRDSILVTDNSGIKVFKADGKFQRLLRPFYQINDFTLSADGRIYANPSFRLQKPNNPLIVELDSTGKRVKAFGARQNGPNKVGLSDEAYLCVADKRIFAVFKHSPVIRAYNTNGELLREFRVDHPAFADLAPLAKDQKFTNPEPSKFRLPTYVSGAQAVGDRLLVLLDLPQPEVVEFDFEGKEQNRYRADISPAVNTYKGFDAKRVGNTYRFWMLAGDGKSFIELFEFTPSQ